MIPVNILDHQLIVLPVIIIIVHLVTTTSAFNPGAPSPRQGRVARGSTSSSSVETLAMEDFQHLTDKLTHKIMMDIEKLKKEDPNFGKQGHMPEEDMTDEQLKMASKCEFHCPDGTVQIENQSFPMPAFKNCKQYDDSWDRIPGASGCCSRHEICYHTCTRDRTQCDMEFRMCIEDVCEELQEKNIIRSTKVIESCKSAMGMLGIMIMEPGCKMYPKAQGVACICVDERKPDDDGGLDGVTFFDRKSTRSLHRER